MQYVLQYVAPHRAVRAAVRGQGVLSTRLCPCQVNLTPSIESHKYTILKRLKVGALRPVALE